MFYAYDASIQKPLSRYLVVWLLCSFGAMMWQFFAPHVAEERSAWGTAPGWQREIALWNAALQFGILTTLLKGDRYQMRALGLVLVVLSLLLGTNHLHTAVQTSGEKASTHWLGAVLNLLLGVGWGASAVLRSTGRR